MFEEITERIKIVQVKKHGKSMSDWSLVLGIKQQTLDKTMRGQQKPSLGLIISILNTYPDISADWLLRGKEYGNPLNSSDPNAESKMAMLCQSQSRDMEWLRKKINSQAQELNDITELLEQKNKLIEKLTNG